MRNGSKRVAIVGAGLMGRVLAVTLLMRGQEVELFDCQGEDAVSSCGYAAAGMLSACAELEFAEPIVYELGRDATDLWRRLLDFCGTEVFLQQSGSLLVCHSSERSRLNRFCSQVKDKLQNLKAKEDAMVAVDCRQIELLEPELLPLFQSAVYLPHEGQVDNRGALAALGKKLQLANVAWHQNVRANIAPHIVEHEGQASHFDTVFDCRGLSARHDRTSLRAVRGELVEVFAPEVHLSRPVRLMHPRYPLYIVPRPGNLYLLGATSLESEDDKDITVQSCLELLSAAYSVHSGFAQASIVGTRVGLRPALPDNLPRIYYTRGLIAINGLYRHGFLLAPALALAAADMLESGSCDDRFADLLSNEFPEATIEDRGSLLPASPVCPVAPELNSAAVGRTASSLEITVCS
jgi:glycine oxidase